MSKQKEIPFGTIVVIHQAIDDENEVYLKGVHGDFDATDIQDFQDEISTVLTGEDYFQGEGIYTLKPTIDYYDYHHEITFELVSFEPLISEEVLMQITNWVKCSERVPEEPGRYLCYVEEVNSLGISHYQWNCSWNGVCFRDDSLSGRVTHWMPLPPPPMLEDE
ncbi:DUF551 domain-containing protein [Providencia vermicola]|uniref:DUF551 domain-containing protein n=2 Tax=Providencia TaxID=586 RepID=UPI0034D48E50